MAITRVTPRPCLVADGQQPCVTRAEYEGLTRKDQEDGLLPVPMCTRHAVLVRHTWTNIVFIRPLGDCT